MTPDQHMTMTSLREALEQRTSEARGLERRLLLIQSNALRYRDALDSILEECHHNLATGLGDPRTPINEFAERITTIATIAMNKS